MAGGFAEPVADNAVVGVNQSSSTNPAMLQEAAGWDDCEDPGELLSAGPTGQHTAQRVDVALECAGCRSKIAGEIECHQVQAQPDMGAPLGGHEWDPFIIRVVLGYRKGRSGQHNSAQNANQQAMHGMEGGGCGVVQAKQAAADASWQSKIIH